jgi:3D (Asp-Asp-Asp) domain-containing protein
MRYILSLLLMVGFVGCATTSKPTASNSKAAKTTTPKRMTVRTTAYTHTEPGGRVNAIGGRLRYAHAQRSAASDWSWMPLGTRFKLLSLNKEYVIEDYGSALVNRKTIDLYFPTRSSMRNWGCRQEEIEILEWGSDAMSLKLLAPRTRNKHVATMVSNLRKQNGVGTEKTAEKTAAKKPEKKRLAAL